MGDSRNHPDKSAAFPVTDWQQLDRLKLNGDPGQTPVLGLLAERYWIPNFSFPVSQGYTDHEAGDMALKFFAGPEGMARAQPCIHCSLVGRRSAVRNKVKGCRPILMYARQ